MDTPSSAPFIAPSTTTDSSRCVCCHDDRKTMGEFHIFSYVYPKGYLIRILVDGFNPPEKY